LCRRGFNPSATLNDCVISNNSAEDGGGVYCRNSSPTVTNCTISDNSATNDVSGVYCYWYSPMFINCILRNQGSTILVESGNPVIIYSNIEGGYIGIGNIDQDPLFVDAVNGDYQLRSLAGSYR
jgi:predicted outer membrane repeat protein